jgi:hypothetical protein
VIILITVVAIGLLALAATVRAIVVDGLPQKADRSF